MSIGWQKDHIPIFNLADKSWDHNGYIFQCIPTHEDEVCITKSSLIPVLNHHFGDDIEKCFTPNMAERMPKAQYDPNSGNITSPMDEHILCIAEGNLDFDLVDINLNHPELTANL